MNLGAEPKKIAILGGLLLLGGYSFYVNVLSEPELPEGARANPAARATTGGTSVPGLPQPPAPQLTAPKTARRTPGRAAVAEFRPAVRASRPEDRPDPMKVDPTLRLDLLARLKNMSVEGGSRSLFEFSAAPPPPPAVKDPIKVALGETKKGKPGSATAAAEKPPEAEVKPPGPPPKPPPPPIPLKFYGFSAQRTGGVKRAFFLEGEEIFVVHEGDLVKKRYKVVRIGLNSVVVEDTEHKHQQTLPLEEPPATG